MNENNQEKVENTAIENTNTDNFKSVFIIHGHNDGLKESVARVIEKQGIKVIILHEQADEGVSPTAKFVSTGRFPSTSRLLQSRRPI